MTFSSSGNTIPQRLLIVSPTFWPEPLGTPRYVYDASRWFAERGTRVTVVTNQPHYPQFRRYPGFGRRRRRERLEGTPIDVVRLPTLVPTGGHPALRAASDVNMLIQSVIAGVRRVVPRHEQVLSFSPGTPFAALIGAALRRRHGRHVCVVHDVQSGLASSLGYSPPFLGGLMRAVESFCLSRPDVVLALSGAMKSALHEIGLSAPVDVVPIWVDDVEPEEGNSAPGRVVTVMYSGNLGRKHGVIALADLAERLSAARPDRVRLVIQGAGTARDELAAEIRRRRMANVELRAPAPDERLAATLAEGDVHVVPSLPGAHSYVLPSKVFNVLAVRRPIVAATDPGSPLEELASRCGAIAPVPPGDPEAMASAVIDLVDDSDRRRRMGEAGRRYVVEHHARDRVLGRIAAHLGLVGAGSTDPNAAAETVTTARDAPRRRPTISAASRSR